MPKKSGTSCHPLALSVGVAFCDWSHSVNNRVLYVVPAMSRKSGWANARYPYHRCGSVFLSTMRRRDNST